MTSREKKKKKIEKKIPNCTSLFYYPWYNGYNISIFFPGTRRLPLNTKDEYLQQLNEQHQDRHITLILKL